MPSKATPGHEASDEIAERWRQAHLRGQSSGAQGSQAPSVGPAVPANPPTTGQAPDHPMGDESDWTKVTGTGRSRTSQGRVDQGGAPVATPNRFHLPARYEENNPRSIVQRTQHMHKDPSAFTGREATGFTTPDERMWDVGEVPEFHQPGSDEMQEPQLMTASGSQGDEKKALEKQVEAAMDVDPPAAADTEVEQLADRMEAELSLSHSRS